jgi:DNA-binding MarR family transcriptional regulator
MGPPAPLDSTEDELWRALVVVLRTLPRVLEEELQSKASMSSREYATLANLADQQNKGLRINQLAVLVGLSASRMSRLIDTLAARGEVQRHQDADDARSMRLAITPEGLSRLEAAWPHALASVRRYVMDHVDAESMSVLTEAFKALVGDPRQPAQATTDGDPEDVGVGPSDEVRRAGPGRENLPNTSEGLQPRFLQPGRGDGPRGAPEPL